MMYQCLSDIPPARSPADAENEGHDHTHEEVGHHEECGGDEHHHEHHERGDESLTPARPRDLLRLDAHLLQEFKRTDLHHTAYLPPSRACGSNSLRFLNFAERSGLRLAGVEGLEPTTPGFGDGGGSRTIPDIRRHELRRSADFIGLTAPLSPSV